MKYSLLASVIFCLSISSAVAGGVADASPETKENPALIKELSLRSGLAEPELNSLLENCDANQQSMYFCAWRNQISAEKMFSEVLGAKQSKIPGCKQYFHAQAKGWALARDKGCEQSATKQWGEGSMKPTAQMICAAAETYRMTKKLERMNDCQSP